MPAFPNAEKLMIAVKKHADLLNVFNEAYAFFIPLPMPMPLPFEI